MSYTFRVVFDGVCAYVPNQPFFVNENAKAPVALPPVHPNPASTDPPPRKEPTDQGALRQESTDPIASSQRAPSTDPRPCEEKWRVGKDVESLAVLLPDLRRPATPRVPSNPRLNFPSFREPHFPLLTFRLGDLRERTTRRVDLVCRDISELDEQGLLFLRREQIRFKLKAENANKFSFADWIPYDPKQPLPELDQREQLESLWWLPDLSRIVDPRRVQDAIKATQARADFLPSYRGPFPDGLIARVECTGGRLRTYDFNRNVDDVPLQWRFADPANAWEEGSWNRALANSVALEFFDVQSEVRIELKRLANEVVIEELVLAPAPGASRPVLEVFISNREPDLLFQQEGFGRLILPDMDFQPFYELMSPFEGEVADLPIPHPARVSFFGIREKPCAGAVMSPEGEATNG